MNTKQGPRCTRLATWRYLECGERVACDEHAEEVKRLHQQIGNDIDMVLQLVPLSDKDKELGLICQSEGHIEEEEK